MENQNNNTHFTYKLLFFYNLYFFQHDIFLLDHNKLHQKQKISAFDIIEWHSTEMWSVSYVTYIDTIPQVSLPQWSIFSFLDMLTLKFRIIIIVLSTDQPEIILPTARNTNKLSYLRLTNFFLLHTLFSSVFSYIF